MSKKRIGLGKAEWDKKVDDEDWVETDVAWTWYKPFWEIPLSRMFLVFLAWI